MAMDCCLTERKHPKCPFPKGHYFSIKCPGDRAFLMQQCLEWLEVGWTDDDAMIAEDLDAPTRRWLKRRIALLRLAEAGEQ